MANTPPPPAPAPLPTSDPSADAGASASQGGLDRDVHSILANLNQEQLASIVAAARASEGNAQGSRNSMSNVDASSILAALPPGLGQAATALTSFASSFNLNKREGENGEQDAQEIGEHREGDVGVDPAAEEVHVGEEANEDGAAAAAVEDGVEGGEDKKALEGDQSVQEYTHAGADESEHHGGADQTTTTMIDDTFDETTEEYRNEQTQAAIAAMESLAAQSGVPIKGAGRAKRDTGPEAERLRKDQHKEVERKRREQISNGITELANIVPGCDTKGINKTAIINSAVRYIIELKDNEASNIEKWTLEKLLMDQAMGDLGAQLDALRKENAKFRAQLGLPEEPEQYGEEVEQHEQGEQQEGVAGEAEMHELATGTEEADVVAAAAAAAAATEDDAIDPAMQDLKKDDEKAADALNQVAEAAIAAAQANKEDGVEEIAQDVTEEGKELPDDESATIGVTRPATTDDSDASAGGRAKRSRVA